MMWQRLSRSAANNRGVRMFRLVHAASIWRLVTCVALAVVLACGNAASATLPKREDVKATLTRQPQLLSDLVRDLQPPTAGLSQLYFVGFAGFGGQAVFKREVLAVRQLFDERFGTRSRKHAQRCSTCHRFEPQPCAPASRPPRDGY